jgi:dCMP deaminase
MLRQYDRNLMKLAQSLARSSDCKRLQVGCLIVDTRSFVVASACNKQLTPCTGEPGACGAVHAEMAAGAWLDDPRFHTMYVTHSPCLECARSIVDAGVIKRVYFGQYYRSLDGLQHLEASGIEVGIL